MWGVSECRGLYVRAMRRAIESRIGKRRDGHYGKWSGNHYRATYASLQGRERAPSRYNLDVLSGIGCDGSKVARVGAGLGCRMSETAIR